MYSLHFERPLNYRLLRPERIYQKDLTAVLTVSLCALFECLILATVRGRVLGQMDYWADSLQPVVFYLSSNEFLLFASEDKRE